MKFCSRAETQRSQFLLCIFSALLSVFLGISQLRAQVVENESYVDALREFDHADPDKDGGLNQFMEKLLAAAESGNADAQKLAAAFHSGEATAYKGPADSGNPVAQTMLGTFLVYGEGISKNVELGRKYLLSAANQTLGGAQAQFELAKLYLDGIGVPQNDLVMLRWTKRAAANGNPRAVSALALYEKGTAKQKAREEERDRSAQAKCAHMAETARASCILLMRRLSQ